MNHPEAGPPGDPAAVTEQPWLRKKKWRTGVIKGESMKAFWVILGFAAVWNAVSISMVVQAWDQVFDPSNRIALLALVFPLVGLSMLSRACAHWCGLPSSSFLCITSPRDIPPQPETSSSWPSSRFR